MYLLPIHVIQIPEFYQSLLARSTTVEVCMTEKSCIPTLLCSWIDHDLLHYFPLCSPNTMICNGLYDNEGVLLQ